MYFSINIYEEGNPNAATVFEHARAQTLNLTWSGGPSKLRTIVGSDLAFTMEVTDFQDAYFEHLNTQDERQYRVAVVNEETQAILWSGHLLPDLYDEPYTQGAFFVEFVASCGLGSLKGQQLPVEFYVMENSMASILAACLSLTGLELPIKVSPAVRNKVEPLWHDNYVHGARWVDDGKRKDAYEILEDLLGPINCIFQQDNAWHIVGVNKFNRFSIFFDVYTAAGQYQQTEELVRTFKTPMFFAAPRIGTHAPRKRVEAAHQIEQDTIPETAYKVKNLGYALQTPAVLIAHDWAYSNTQFKPLYSSKDGKVYLEQLGTYDANIYAYLRRPLLIGAGTKVRWLIALKSAYDSTAQGGQTPEELVANGSWSNVVPYDIYYTDPATGNEILLYSNKNGAAANDARYALDFNTERTAEQFIDMVAPASAYYNIRFYRPVGTLGIKIDRIYITNLNAEVLTDTDDVVYTNEIKQLFTQIEETELPLHDDFRDIDNLVRIRPLVSFSDTYDTEVVNGVTALEVDGLYYVRMSLSFLLLCIEHKENLSVGGQPLIYLGHVFNYLDSNEMLLQYDADAFGAPLEDGDNITVTLKRFSGLPVDVAEWQQWADDFYGITYKRYGEAVVEVLRNLYTRSHPILRGSCRGFISFLDLIMFNYNGDKVFYPLDISWQMDQHRSTLILSQNFYGQAVTENLPPVVDAGVDQVLTGNDSTVTLVATASDPDGTIVSVQWQVFGSPAGVTFGSADELTTTVSGLTGNAYEFMVTVTDDVGLTASDTVSVTREVGYQLVLTQVTDVEYDQEFEAFNSERYNITIEPPLQANQTARVTFEIVIVENTPRYTAGARPTGVAVVGLPFNANYQGAGRYVANALYVQGTVGSVSLTAKAFNSADDNLFPEIDGNVYAMVQIDITAEMVTGAPGTFTNLPIQLMVEARK